MAAEITPQAALSHGCLIRFCHHIQRKDDLILTARREAEFEAAHSITAHVFALDLGARGGADARVDILISNTGFGGHGLHIERDLAAEMANTLPPEMQKATQIIGVAFFLYLTDRSIYSALAASIEIITSSSSPT